MRVLYFHQYFKTPGSPGAFRSYNMAKALLDAGHDVHMVCGGKLDDLPGFGKEFKNGRRTGVIEGIQVTQLELLYSKHLSLPKRAYVFVRYALNGAFLALREDYDLVFASSTPLTAGIPGIFARWLRRKKFVFEVRDLWPELPKAMGVVKNPVVLGAMSVLEWASYRSSDGCIGLSSGIVEGIRKRSNPRLDIALIPNGCDLQTFAPREVDSVEIDNINKTDFVAIFTGAHGIANGLDSVLDVAAILKKDKVDDIKFLFIGDGNRKKSLLKRKKNEDLNNCIFLDPVAQNQLHPYLKRADVALMILANVPEFYYGTSPNKFFSYLAAGKAVINNYPGWLADMINEHSLGSVVPPDSPGQFAETLKKLRDDQASLKIMGSNALELAKNQFDKNELAKRHVKFLEKVWTNNR